MLSEKRLHPFFILYGTWKLIKENIFFIILFFVINFRTESMFIRTIQLLFLTYIVGRIIYLVLKWLTHRYEVVDEAIHLKTGVIKRSDKFIPFEKVQNIHRHTTILHKLFKVTTLTLETGSAGGKSSIKFDAISLEGAESLERLIVSIQDEKKIDSPVDNSRNVIKKEAIEKSSNSTLHFKPEKRDLLKASFTSFSFLLIIPIVFGIYENIDMLFDVDQITNNFMALLTRSWWIASIILTVLIIFAVIIGIANTFLKYGKYEIYSDNDSIYIKKGVLEEISFSIEKKKVQAVQVNQSIIKRMLRLAEVRLVTAGDAGNPKYDVNSLFPYMPIDRAYSIIEEILPEYKVEKEMHGLNRNAFLLRMIRPSYFWIILTIIIFYFKSSFWYISLILLILIYCNRVVDYKNSYYLIHDEFIQLKYGGFWSTFIVSKRSKVIEIEIKQSKIQKKFGLATLIMENRSKPFVTKSYSYDVPNTLASTFYRWYLHRGQEIQLDKG